MRACGRLDDRVCLEWFAVEQGLRQGWVLTPLLFNIFFAAVINVTYTRIKADKYKMDALFGASEEENGAEGGGGGEAAESSSWRHRLGHALR